MERLAEAIKLAAKHYEESFDKKASKKAIERNEFVDHKKFYTMSLWKAADKATEEVGFDTRGTKLVYLLLTNSWNDALEWTKYFDDKK